MIHEQPIEKDSLIIEPDLLPALYNLSTVARLGNFRLAAKHLGVSPSAVSHSIAMLERRLNMQLLTRTTRSVSLTAEGRAVLDGLNPAIEQIANALDNARSLAGSLSGNLRIASPRSVAKFLLVPLLLEFKKLYPEVTVELQADDRLQDIVADGFDFGIRFDDTLEQDMIAIAIGAETRVILVASPEYIDKYGEPLHPNELHKHSCIGRRFPSGVVYTWQFENGDEYVSITPQPSLILNDDELVKLAALSGSAIGFAFEQSVRQEIHDGNLVQILADWAEPYERCYLYWPRSRTERPINRAFIDFARAYKHTE